MKNISIKSFIIFLFVVLLSSESIIFYNFYIDSKKTLSNILEENIKMNIVSIRHFLNKNLKENNINELITFLDNKINSDNLLKDIHIISKDGKLLYSTDRSAHPKHTGVKCKSISNISSIDIYKQQCYTFYIRQYHRLTPYYLSSDIYIDTKNIQKIERKVQSFLYYSIVSFLLFFIFIWFLVRRVMILPLEKLRQYAYYSTEVPKKFFIKELESIRYSLHITFSRLKKEQEKLYKLSTKDSLSGLYNRFSLMEKLNWLVNSSKRKESKFALLFLDLDDFKTINDTIGHEFGDKVLVHISNILLHSVRSDDIVSRVGGDEFVIVLPDYHKEGEILEVIHRIQQKISTPFTLENIRYHVTCSIGIVVYPKDANNTSELLKDADIAMYKAKETGKNTFHFFTEELDIKLQNRVLMQNTMIEAYEKGYFQLFYQPKVSLQSGKIIACEALVRIQDPKQGIISPDKFIQIAEETGFIIVLGKWIIEESVRQIKAWKNTEFKNIKISINVSGIQLKDEAFLSHLKHAVKDIDTSKLDIELTESVLIDNYKESLNIIQQIKELGITLSLDDFGTGYSSLSYLKNIPFNTLKIDKSFIDDLSTEQGKSFVNMILKIAQELQMEVVAEGPEEKEQIKYLKKVGCQQYQGYYCSKPLPAQEFEKLFLQHHCP